MFETANRLRSDALRIWQAGLDAVGSERLIRECVHVDSHWLTIGGMASAEPIDLNRVGQIAVVGAGKAGAGMAAALEETLGPRILDEKRLVGWVNVPADCVRRLAKIHLHAARPAGVNEPTAEGVSGAMEILRIVGSLSPEDLCIALISGGGSALLPGPPLEISLADKLAVTRRLSAAGADITELNTVRKHLSLIKGGGLLRACAAGRLINLIISDVLGDPLDLIASGPTVEDHSTAADALAILARFDAEQAAAPAAVYAYLRRKSQSPAAPPPAQRLKPVNIILANNATAVDAAGLEAVRSGYSPALMSAAKPEGDVEEIGRRLARMAIGMRRRSGPDCLISGGEGTVRLTAEGKRGKGGRNMHLALAAFMELSEHNSRDIALVSGGTDGEDGPTDMAGAVVDEIALCSAREVGIADSAGEFLQRNDSYKFFNRLDRLLHTGPTHTNVGDLRVIVVRRGEAQ